MAIQQPAQPADRPASPFILVTTPVTIAGRQLQLTHPRSVDDLIDEKAFDIDERLPYWGTIWPSARVLARRISTLSGGGRRLLELGCGVGLVSLSAALAGFDVLATDYFAEACQMTAANAERNGIAGLRTRVVDWRNFPAELADFDFVVASDVLYERGNTSLVTAAIARSLAADGVAWLTDPGRRVAGPFAAECKQFGLKCDCIDLEQVVDGDWKCVVETFEIRRQA
jgi:predicted nicotinamide N-methyase